MEVGILCNDNISVTNCIMDSYVFITMGTTLEVDTHRVNGM
jgi:hypothetical protein